MNDESKKLLEDKINELKEKAKELAKMRDQLVQTMDKNTADIIKIGGAIEEMKKMLNTDTEEKK